MSPLHVVWRGGPPRDQAAVPASSLPFPPAGHAATFSWWPERRTSGISRSSERPRSGRLRMLKSPSSRLLGQAGGLAQNPGPGATPHHGLDHPPAPPLFAAGENRVAHGDLLEPARRSPAGPIPRNGRRAGRVLAPSTIRKLDAWVRGPTPGARYTGSGRPSCSTLSSAAATDVRPHHLSRPAAGGGVVQEAALIF